VFSGHDMVMAGVSEAPMSCLLGEGTLSPPSLSEAVCNSLVESLVIAYSGDSGLLRVEPMVAASELSLRGERLRPPKQSAMNSSLP
jgi:hypothetical protein